MDSSDKDLFNEIDRVFKDHQRGSPKNQLMDWIGNIDILKFIVNSNMTHPRKDFILELIVLSKNLIYTFSAFLNENIYGAIPIKSISSVTVSINKDEIIDFQINMDSGLTFRMHLLYKNWDQVISFKSEIQNLLENIR